jgi:hypothetical protein
MFWVIVALFANFEFKCAKNGTFSRFVQKVKSNFLPISTIHRWSPITFETFKPSKLRLVQKRLLFCLSGLNEPGRLGSVAPSPLTSFPLSVRISAGPHPPPLDKGGRRPLTDGGHLRPAAAYGLRPLTAG